MIPLSHSLILGCTLFIIGLLGVITRRSPLLTSFSLIIINISLCYILFCVGIYEAPEDGRFNFIITIMIFCVQLGLTSGLVAVHSYLKKVNKT